MVNQGPSSATLDYRAAPGERNEVSVVGSADSTGALLLSVSDGARNLEAGPGCVRFSDSTADCTLPVGYEPTAHFELGDGADRVDFDDAPIMPARIYGGEGDDRLEAPGSYGLGGTPIWISLTGVGELRPSGASAGGSLVSGGRGGDHLYGGQGDDVLRPGAGEDYVQARRGSDRILARDGSRDVVECDHRDAVVADRLDLPFGQRCDVSRRGAFPTTPLGAFISDFDGLRLQLYVGCPADASRACVGVVTARVRGGRRVVSRRFRLRPGEVGGPNPYLADATARAAIRRGLVVTVNSLDTAGHARTVSRVIGPAFSLGPN